MEVKSKCTEIYVAGIVNGCFMVNEPINEVFVRVDNPEVNMVRFELSEGGHTYIRPCSIIALAETD